MSEIKTYSVLFCELIHSHLIHFSIFHTKLRKKVLYTQGSTCIVNSYKYECTNNKRIYKHDTQKPTGPRHACLNAHILGRSRNPVFRERLQKQVKTERGNGN